MILLALLLAVLGTLLCAFFSGSETGLYRATRLRLVLDSMSGNRVARGLLWLVNHPAFFVATVLVGNNLANYLVSLALVLIGGALVSGDGIWAEMLVPLAFAPVLFVYGELVPKSFFLDAPNRLLRPAGPLLLLFAVLFAPISVVVWAFNRLLERFLHQRTQPVQSALARRELARLFEEGREVELLTPVQRAMAEAVFTVSGEVLGRMVIPLAQVPRARPDMTRDAVLGLAQRYRLSTVCVEQPDEDRRLVGYYRVVELAMADEEGLPRPWPLLGLADRTSLLSALIHMQSSREELAAVIDEQGKTLGIVTLDDLRDRLFPMQKATQAGPPVGP